MVATFLVTDANLIRSAAPEDERLAIIARGRAIKKLLDGIIDYMGPPGLDHLEPGNSLTGLLTTLSTLTTWDLQDLMILSQVTP